MVIFLSAVTLVFKKAHRCLSDRGGNLPPRELYHRKLPFGNVPCSLHKDFIVAVCIIFIIVLTDSEAGTGIPPQQKRGGGGQLGAGPFPPP